MKSKTLTELVPDGARSTRNYPKASLQTNRSHGQCGFIPFP